MADHQGTRILDAAGLPISSANPLYVVASITVNSLAIGDVAIIGQLSSLGAEVIYPFGLGANTVSVGALAVATGWDGTNWRVLPIVPENTNTNNHMPVLAVKDGFTGKLWPILGDSQGAIYTAHDCATECSYAHVVSTAPDGSGPYRINSAGVVGGGFGLFNIMLAENISLTAASPLMFMSIPVGNSGTNGNALLTADLQSFQYRSPQIGGNVLTGVNTTCTFVIEPICSWFEFTSRNLQTFCVGFVDYSVAGTITANNYKVIQPGSSYYQENVSVLSNTNIYIQSEFTNAVIELEKWYR
jgi:hypothetical protein